MATAALLVLLQIAATDTQGCRDGQVSLVTSVGELIARGDTTKARELVAALPSDSGSCVSLELMRRALDAWFEARAVAKVAGADENLGRARNALGHLRRLGAPPAADAAAGTAEGARASLPAPASDVLALQVEYADTLGRAAIAAAQDERPEMELLLDHARDLVQRLEYRGERARWPQPYSVAAGELWFEVDRYEDARAAYQRAAQVEPSAVALVGLARAEARLGKDDACATFRRAVDAAPELRAEATRSDLARCR